MSDHTLHLGDCLDVMRTMADCSVDAVVTDPPYGLSFMGKAWDYDVPGVDVWREILRVLKPGGHLLAFAGTRTQHRMAVAIEDAGFEIRDMIAWVYGSGFPKSQNVGKAIDKLDAAQTQQARRYRFTEWVRSTGLTSKQIDEATGTNMGGHYTTAASQPAIMTREHLDAVRHLISEVPDWVEHEADIRSVESENFKKREVVGTEVRYNEPSGIVAAGRDERTLFERKITTAHTPEAQQWEGWGTALKPALEPVTVARKPFKGTVAANVLEHGTGAINVDGCRVGAEPRPLMVRTDTLVAATSMAGVSTGATDSGEVTTLGRWPANLIHDGSDEVTELFPQTGNGNNKGVYSYAGKEYDNKNTSMFNGDKPQSPSNFNDSGSAARFFYTAKAAKAERQGVTHPTVKPLDLMAYLCRLVTPPGGTVLDPFMGSGTTIKAALSEGFNAIGVERDPAYFAMAEHRMNGAQLGLGLDL